MRLGRYSEAAERYEKLLVSLKTAPRKYRISIRDQAADCYRRWMERDSEHDEENLIVVHFNRAIEILSEAIIAEDADHDTGRRLALVLEVAAELACGTQ